MMSLLLGYHPVSAQSPIGTTGPQQPVVRAVMFWMDTCGHCHYVIEEVLPPLKDQYQNQLEITLIELQTTEDIDLLYQTAAALGIAKEEVGVPFLVIGDQVLKGSAQIPAELPGLIEHYLAQGGVDYPNLPTLAEVLPASALAATTEGLCNAGASCSEGLSAAQTDALSIEAQSPENRAPAQPSNIPIEATTYSNGFTLAIFVMVGMFVSLLFVGIAFVRGAPALPRIFSMHGIETALPVLCLIGLGVAGYLAFVEIREVRAICGPVGDCNTVQSSPYARLFGVLPVGVLGIAGYLAILTAWLYHRLWRDRIARYMPIIVFSMTFFGVLFSLYLTFLEPFVIRAVCIWCIISAVIMTLLLLLSLKPALQVIQSIQEADDTYDDAKIKTTTS
jgi:uncharacterized membrane protein